MPAVQTEPVSRPWAEMDYGPFKSGSLVVERGNYANKGIAIRVDEGEGGVSQGSEFLLFETDTLRWAAGWVGEGFIDWQGINFDEQHNIHPSVIGDVSVNNPTGPGWGNPKEGGFEDPRLRGRDDRPYGPLPRS